MPKSKTSDIVLGCIGALVLIVGLAGTYYYYNKNNELSIIANTKQMELKALQRKIKNYNEMQAKLTELEAEESRLANFIPTQEQQTEFIWELEEIASKTGTTITQCNIEKDVKVLAKHPQYHVYQWRLNVEGDFTNLDSFLKALMESRRSAMVSELKVSSSEPSDKDKQDVAYVLRVDMMLDLISKSDQEKVAK